MYKSHQAVTSPVMFSQAKWTMFFLLGFIMSVAFFACKNNGDIPPVVKTTYLDVINADVNTLNIYQNGTRVNNTSGLYQYGNSGYLVVNAGTTNFDVKLAGNSNYLINNYSLTLDTGNQYSLFIAGETPDKLFLISDHLGLPDSASVSIIRFVNASLSNLTISLGALKYTNQAFKSASSFRYITSDTTTVSVYQPGSSIPLLKQPVVLLAGTVYTLFTAGMPGGTGQNALVAQLITNGTE